MAFAEKTKVPVDRSRAEIEDTLARYGAGSFGYMQKPKLIIIGFECHNRLIQITVPKMEDEQENRRRWRALLLVIKAKLEAVHSGIATFEDEFLAYTVMPNGQTVAECLQPQIEAAKESGKMPQLMLGAGS